MAKNSELKKLLLKLFIAILLLFILIFNPISSRLMTLGVAIWHNLDPVKFYRLVAVESSFRSFAVSSKQAIGLGQVKESTARYMSRSHRKGMLYIPLYNLDISAKYMKYLLNRYNGNWSVALAAYNWGETNVDRRLRNRKIDPKIDYTNLFSDIPETRAYIRKILRSPKS